MEKCGRNFVEIQGEMSYIKFSYIGDGVPKFSGKVGVPIKHTSRDGAEYESKTYIKVVAYGTMASALVAEGICDGMWVRIQGNIQEHSYESKCSSCEAPSRRYWTEVLINNFIVVE